MKNKLVIGIIAIFILSIVSAIGFADPTPSQIKFTELTGTKQTGGIMKIMQASCTPNSGFEWCYEDDYTANGCTAEYKINGKYIDQTARSCQINGQWKTCYVGNTLTTRVDTWSADDLYLMQDFSSWSDAWSHIDCDEDGCSHDSHAREINDGTVTLETAPAQIRNYAYFAYDMDYCTCGEYCDDYWTYIYGAAGYTGPWSNMYLVRCLENSDCDSGKVCDRSGDWDDWACVSDPCASVTCADTCDGTTRKYNGQCSNGQCSYSEENCANNNYYGDFVNYCSGDELRKHRVYHQFSCLNGGCRELQGINWVDDQLVNDCDYGCDTQANQCKGDPCANVACDDYCDGTTGYHSGQCSDGQCSYQTEFNSTDCGYEEPEITGGILNPSLFINDVKIFEYDGVLDKMVYVNDYSEVLNDYLENCEPDENGNCQIPIEVKGDSDGIIKLKDLNILYEETITEPEEPIEEPEEPINVTEPEIPEEPINETEVNETEEPKEDPWEPIIDEQAELWFKHCAKSEAPVGGGYAAGSVVLFDADNDGGLEEHHMVSVAFGFPEQIMQYTTPEGYIIKKVLVGGEWKLAISVENYNYLYRNQDEGVCNSDIEGDVEREVCVNQNNEKVECITNPILPEEPELPQPVVPGDTIVEPIEEPEEEPPEVPVVDPNKTNWDSKFTLTKKSDKPVGDGYGFGAELEFDSNGDGTTECYRMDSSAFGFEEQILPFTTPDGYKMKRLKIGNSWDNIAIEVENYNYLYKRIHCN